MHSNLLFSSSSEKKIQDLLSTMAMDEARSQSQFISACKDMTELRETLSKAQEAGIVEIFSSPACPDCFAPQENHESNCEICGEFFSDSEETSFVRLKSLVPRSDDNSWSSIMKYFPIEGTAQILGANYDIYTMPVEDDSEIKLRASLASIGRPTFFSVDGAKYRVVGDENFHPSFASQPRHYSYNVKKMTEVLVDNSISINGNRNKVKQHVGDSINIESKNTDQIRAVLKEMGVFLSNQDEKDPVLHEKIDTLVNEKACWSLTKTKDILAVIQSFSVIAGINGIFLVDKLKALLPLMGR